MDGFPLKGLGRLDLVPHLIAEGVEEVVAGGGKASWWASTRVISYFHYAGRQGDFVLGREGVEVATLFAF